LNQSTWDNRSRILLDLVYSSSQASLSLVLLHAASQAQAGGSAAEQAADAAAAPEQSPLAHDRGEDVCFKCQQPGHWSRDCPGLGGSAGAMRPDGPAGIGGTGAGSQPEPSPLPTYRSQDVCFKCQLPGHWSRDCPGIRGGPAADDGRRASGAGRGGAPMPSPLPSQSTGDVCFRYSTTGKLSCQMSPAQDTARMSGHRAEQGWSQALAVPCSMPSDV